MATGLRAYDPAGNLVLDFTDRITKVAGAGSISGQYTPTAINIAGMTDSVDWYVQASEDTLVDYYSGYFTLTLQNWQTAGTTIHYTVFRR